MIASIIITIILFFHAIRADRYNYQTGINGPIIGDNNFGSNINWPYGRQKYIPNDDEVYVRRPYSGNQFPFSQGYRSIMNEYQLPQQEVYGSQFYGNAYKPRFGVFPQVQSPLSINGYPMYPRNTYSQYNAGMFLQQQSYPNMFPMGTQFGSPMVYQGPTVNKLPFKAAS